MFGITVRLKCKGASGGYVPFLQDFTFEALAERDAFRDWIDRNPEKGNWISQYPARTHTNRSAQT